MGSDSFHKIIAPNVQQICYYTPMTQSFTNKELSQLLYDMAAAYQILDENRFKIIAYDKAAESIEHLTQEVKDIWEQGELDQIPGVGKSISQNLDELFRTGHCKHFDDVMSKVPASVFPLLLVPGVGPKKAYKLAMEFHLQDPKSVFDDLRKIIADHKIAKLEGFGEKSEQLILDGLNAYKSGSIKENRLTLPEASAVAREVIEYMQKHPKVEKIDPLGSLRRQVATIGDVDLAAVTEDPEPVIEYFIHFPNQKIIDRGPRGGTILLHNGRQVDLRVQTKKAYGAMLQYFTGSKHHNIHLRTLALEKGKSLNEYGIKDIKTEKVHEYANEKDFYHAIGLPYIEPELREDRGEIEAAQKGTLPHLVKVGDIKGDLHMHTAYEFLTSHDLGQSPVEEHLTMAAELGYEYIGISDHNPKISDLSAKDHAKIMEKRFLWYKDKHKKWQKHHNQKVELFVMCEVDILTDGKLALPQEAFEFVDAVVVSLHSSFTQSRQDQTKRIVTALTAHPKVRIFGHPTGRLLLKREGVDADWSEVMKVCHERDIAMEINAYPDRLDLPDLLVRDALALGVKFCIDTDSHQVNHMKLMPFGVSVARRGWATKKDIVNTNSAQQFSEWLLRKT